MLLMAGCSQPSPEEPVWIGALSNEETGQEADSAPSNASGNVQQAKQGGESAPQKQSPSGASKGEPRMEQGEEAALQEQASQTVPEDVQQAEQGEEDSSQVASSSNTSQNGQQEGQREAKGFLVAIDAGHQRKGNREQEPIGPGAQETKAKVSGGTVGCVSGVPEYELTLTVALKLRDELEARGYQVIMVRETHDVDISNSERAAVANDAGADAFVRIHANGLNDSAVSGALTICQTKDNPYNGALYQSSRDLAGYVLDELVAAAGCVRRKVWETDTMSGINWCQVPVTIVEMGYMTNPQEDVLLVTPEYQDKLVTGIANGIDRFFSNG